MKLDKRWIIFELFRQHKYILTHGYGGSPYPEKVKRSEKKIISAVKKILNKTIKPENFGSIDEQVVDYFYEKKIKHPWARVPLLGPIGETYIVTGEGALLDLTDIVEVYVSPESFSGEIKSKTCGWIAWKVVKGDKSIFTSKHLTSEFEYLVSMNHHKRETAMTEVAQKFIKYKNSKDGRTFKRFFVGNRFWFDDDLDNLWRSLPYVNFLAY